MYRSLLYRNFLSEKDNAIALMKRAWQAQSRDGEGGEKIPLPFLPIPHPLPPNPPFPPNPPPLSSQSPIPLEAQHPN